MPTITAQICLLSLQTVFDLNGSPIVGAQLAFFNADTTTARAVYADAALSVPLTSPVLTDGAGRVPPIFIGPNAYKLQLSDASGALLSTVDNLPGATVTPDPTPDTSTTIPTGTIMPAHRSDVLAGWLVANGKTIGNGASGGTALADDAAAQALYSVLWNADGSLVVSGGRGQSAANDFNAGKTIALPDYRGRALVGRDAMGNTDAGVLTTATLGTPDTLGAQFGLEKIALTLDGMPGHNHGVSEAPAGAFTPAGTLDTQGAHSHTGNTDSQGDHFHQLGAVPVNLQTGGNSAAIQGGSTQFQATTTAGAHVHNVTTAVAGAHLHNFTGTPVGNHQHTISENTVGNGNPHVNVQPSILITVYIKL